NAVYHVTARINRGEMVFNDPAMRKLFLSFIKRVKKKYPMAIYNFCIMGNHIHFAVRPDKDASLSKIMQWLLGNYAKAWNKAHGVKGHLWGDRFFSKIIRTCLAFRHIFNYISKNPVKAGLAAKAEDWEYGGVGQYVRRHFVKGETTIIDIPPWLEPVYHAFIHGCWQD
ncbi:MAG: transposase, partial [Treponema sp.]|nr:transposase [Treponema sp.]